MRINIRNDFIAALQTPATTTEDIAFRANFHAAVHRDPSPVDVPRWRDLAVPIPQTINLEQRFASFAREHMLLAYIPPPDDQTKTSSKSTQHNRLTAGTAAQPNRPT